MDTERIKQIAREYMQGEMAPVIEQMKDLTTKIGGLVTLHKVEKAARDERDKLVGEKLDGLEHTVYGNGSPGLKQDMATVRARLGLILGGIALLSAAAFGQLAVRVLG